jgi:hypothetical protein
MICVSRARVIVREIRRVAAEMTPSHFLLAEEDDALVQDVLLGYIPVVKPVHVVDVELLVQKGMDILLGPPEGNLGDGVLLGSVETCAGVVALVHILLLKVIARLPRQGTGDPCLEGIIVKERGRVEGGDEGGIDGGREDPEADLLGKLVRKRLGELGSKDGNHFKYFFKSSQIFTFTFTLY